MGKSGFDRALRAALSELPPVFRDALTNVAVVVEDWPPDWLLDELGIPSGDTLYGYYHGVPLPERSIQDSGNLPDTISIYRGPLEEDFRDPRELSREIGSRCSTRSAPISGWTKRSSSDWDTADSKTTGEGGSECFC
jgi:predicted Zn-dependent protease with MMP-like domain